jgi:hypothetical protein
MLRSIIAVIAGVVVGSLAVFAFEYVGHAAYPASVAIDKNNPEQLRRLVEVTPFGAKLFVVGGWFAGAFAGGVVALLIANRWAPVAWVVAACFLGLAATNFVAIPHPVWMEISAVGVCALGGAFAIALLRGRYGPPPQPSKKPFA